MRYYTIQEADRMGLIDYCIAKGIPYRFVFAKGWLSTKVRVWVLVRGKQ